MSCSYQRLLEDWARHKDGGIRAHAAAVHPTFFALMVTRRKWRAASKVVVFSLLKREGKVYTAIVLTAHTNSRLPIIRQTSVSGQPRLH